MRKQLLDERMHHTPDAVETNQKSSLFVQNLSYIRVSWQQGLLHAGSVCCKIIYLSTGLQQLSLTSGCLLHPGLLHPGLTVPVQQRCFMLFL